ncbi:uncharacterized protein METZ01_LOCUS333988, partial [marine metagenome]
MAGSFSVKDGYGHSLDDFAPAPPTWQLYEIIGTHQPDKPVIRPAPT